MAEFPVKTWQAHLQEYLNCLELCWAFRRKVDDTDVQEALDALLDEGQEVLASLAGCLRQQGAAPGALELDRRGKATIRELLALPALGDQLLVVQRSLTDLVAWHAAHLPVAGTDLATQDLLVSLLAQTRHMLDQWDQHLAAMGAAKH